MYSLRRPVLEVPVLVVQGAQRRRGDCRCTVCHVRCWQVAHRHATPHRVCHAPSVLSTLCSSELPPPASSCECGVHNSAAALSCASLAAGDATAAESAKVCCWSAMFLSRQGQPFTQVKPAHTGCLSKRSVHADGRRVLPHARSACDVACVRENFPARAQDPRVTID